MAADPSAMTSPRSRTLPPAPEVLGRYVLHDEIASGGMATVYFANLAASSPTPRTFAIKRAHPHLCREPEFVLMFLDEARLAARIRHPNVVRTLDVVDTPTELALVMEYVHGESLWRLLRATRERGEPVPVPVAAAIVVDTLHGLQAAHDATDERGAPLGIVHRDVSPQNVLVGADGVARLVDFGIAKAAGRLAQTKDSTVKGKYAYMAPEQARGEPVTRQADTYAVAVMLWEMLTGERLFAGKTEAETLHRCLVARVRPPRQLAPGIDPAMDAVVLRALARDPAGRYASARDMAEAVEACVVRAHPSEVGAWVTDLARSALAGREAVRRSIEERPLSPSAVRAASSKGGPASDRDVVGLVASARGGEPKRGARRRVAVLSFAAAAVLGGIAASVTVATRTRTSPSPGPVVVTSPPVAELPASPGVSAPAPSSLPADTPPGVTAAPSVEPSTPAATASSSHAPPRAAPSHPRAKPRPSCNPPYSIDAQGREIFKPECM